MDMHIFIEESNIRAQNRCLYEDCDYRINYWALTKYLKDMFDISGMYVNLYTPEPPPGQKKSNAFINSLKKFGFDVFTKAMIPIISKNKEIIGHKCNFDVEITCDIDDLMELSLKRDKYIVIISGDIDFLYLVQKIKKKGFTSILVSFETMTRSALKNAPDYYISFEEFLKNRENNIFFIGNNQKIKDADSRFAKLALLKEENKG